MRIGFDAKRAFYNRSGLGNYSRNTILQLNAHYPQNEYFLYTPKTEGSISFAEGENIKVVSPSGFFNRKLKSFWRSVRLGKQLEKDNIDLYHGLSNELPKNISKTKAKSVVTIHDLIFLRHPEWYKPIDRKIYTSKFRHSCEAADRIIAISQQTKDDIVQYFGIEEEKIDVVYQGCHLIYHKEVDDSFKNQVKDKYQLPAQYMLYVGTIEERKNALNIVKAIHEGEVGVPLVIVGRPTPYLNQIKEYISANQVSNIYFHHNVPLEDLPAIYQMADLFVYPSTFEGFGIPILEALYSKTPVISSKGGCFAEAGGEYSKYINPENIEDLICTIKEVLYNSELREQMKVEGYKHALQFNDDDIAKNIMGVYLKTLQ